MLEYTMDVDREPEEVAELYAMLHNVASASGESKKFMGDLLEKLMGVGDIISIAGAGVTIEKKQGQQRTKWDHNSVRAAVAERILDQYINEETGALDVPPSQLIQRAFDCTGLKWKLTPLRDMNINPDSYCEKKEGRVSFAIGVAAPTNDTKEDEEDDDFL